ncbi:thioredoxin domain-containing protein [Telluribacter sp.]|jgi:thioredoxin|uniref:thioredoxin domain-containing protein n=1 Tax=Telluribacter sp. TaxID=1978767 RepID=UPI002E1217FB|nr:thioredoxin domain-containing protein [Telluribacter sp.]
MKKLVSLFALLLVASAGYAQTKLEVAQFSQQLGSTSGAQLLDVRTPAEYTQGHLPQAINMDFRNEAFAKEINNLDKTKPIYVYCLSGGRSAAAAQKLVEQGFKEVYDMQGGYLKWSAAGNTVTAATAGTTPKDAISEEAFAKLISSNKPVLIDFYAPWCAPCKQMMPSIKKLTKEYEGKATIETINYDQNKALARQLGVDEIPVFLLYKNGKLLWRGMGLMPEKEFRQVLEANL